MTAEFRVGDLAPQPPRPIPESELIANRVNGLPTATILCVTFQAADFIADALSGMLSQISSYPFHVIVRDDGSTDGTQDILREFASEYPETIHLVLESENTYESIRPFSALASFPLGDFVLLCEGDDYWLDPLKLEKQISALQSKPSAVVAFHDSIVIDEGRITAVSRLLGKGRDYTAAEVLAGARMTADTLCFRNVGIPISPYELRFEGWIKVIRTHLGEHGSAIFLKDVIPSVYRRHSASITRRQSPAEATISTASTNFWIAVTLAERGHAEAARSHLKRAANQILGASEFLNLGPTPRESERRLSWPLALRALQRVIPLRRR